MANEKRLIDANALVDAIEDIDWYHVNAKGKLVDGANPANNTPIYKAFDIYNAIKNAPTVDAVEVGSDPTAAGGGNREGSEWQRSAGGEPALSGEGSAGYRNRTHCQWKKTYTCSGEWLWAYECDQCNAENPRASYYCPNCGAKMDGDGNG